MTARSVSARRLREAAGPVRDQALRLWSDRSKMTLPTITVWLMILIMIVPQGLDYRGINGMPSSGDAISRVTWLVLLGLGAYLTTRRVPRLKAFVREVNPFIWGLLLLASASVLWSIEPTITTRRVTRLVTILLVCVGFAVSRWKEQRFQKHLRSILTWLLIASVIFVMLDPEDAIHMTNQPESKDAWHGVTIGKNVLGSLASAALVLWLHAWLSREAGALKAFGGIAIAALCLVRSRSSTSLMATVFAVGFMLLLLRSPGSLRRYMPYLVGSFAAVILIYALAVLRLVPALEIILKPVVALTGKDLTFTGRTAIWEILNEHIRQRPWLGTGYGAYWIGRIPTSPSYEMFTRLYFYPTEGHNGYLDVINDLGAVGGACLVGYFVAYIRQALQLMRLDRYQGGLYLTLLFRGFMADMSESHWFSALAIDFAFMTLATMSLARDLVQARIAAALPVQAPAPTGGETRDARQSAGLTPTPMRGPLARHMRP